MKDCQRRRNVREQLEAGEQEEKIYGRASQRRRLEIEQLEPEEREEICEKTVRRRLE